MRHYEPAGDLLFEFFSQNKTVGSSHLSTTTESSTVSGSSSRSSQSDYEKNYSRELDLASGICKVEYQNGGVTFTREMLVSHPAGVFAMHIESSELQMISFDAMLQRAVLGSHMEISSMCDSVKIVDEGMLELKVSSGGSEGIEMSMMMAIDCGDGEMSSAGEKLVIKNASQVSIYVAIETSFRNANPSEACLQKCKNALSIPFHVLKKDHISDHGALFNRMDIRLGTGSPLPTNILLEGEDDTQLAELYYKFGRYLLIASSRPGSLAANLQGIWNKDFDPPWGSRYTININIQMIYWIAELCNLSELHQPLFDLITRTVKNGRVTAEVMYGCQGFVVHHNTDIWGDSCHRMTQ